MSINQGKQEHRLALDRLEMTQDQVCFFLLDGRKPQVSMCRD